MALCVAVAGLSFLTLDPAEAGKGDRTLRLYFTHTGQKGEFAFRKNGKYDRKVLEQMNVFLRDWRRNEPTKMDPQLFDLIWEVQQRSGAVNQTVTVLSAYRSLETNNMLRKRSRAVAQRSQHTRGKALDFFIPGVPASKLRAIALTMQRGGVGYYPSSRSPFVHLDTGSVRHWPRMTRPQLVALFPKGETLHVPTDGKPLPGYERALAKYSRKGGTAVAYADASSGGGRKSVGAWLKQVFSGGADEEEDTIIATGKAPKPDPVVAAAPTPVRAAKAKARKAGEPTEAEKAVAQEPVVAEPVAAEPAEPVAPAIPAEPEAPALAPSPRPAAPGDILFAAAAARAAEVAADAAAPVAVPLPAEAPVREEAPVTAEPVPGEPLPAESVVASVPLPQSVPLKTRFILAAAAAHDRDVAGKTKTIETAAAPLPPLAAPADEPTITAVEAIAAQTMPAGAPRPVTETVALAFASVPKGRPAGVAPVAKEPSASGDTADAALDALFATAQGGNPEGGAGETSATEVAEGEEAIDPSDEAALVAAREDARRKLATLVLDAPSVDVAQAPAEGDEPEATSALPAEDAGETIDPAPVLLASANAFDGLAGSAGEAAPAAVPAVATEDGESRPTPQDRPRRTAAEPAPLSAAPAVRARTVATVAVTGQAEPRFVRGPIDPAHLQPFMSPETTRTKAFAQFSAPRPLDTPDLYVAAPASAPAQAKLGKGDLRTDRFAYAKAAQPAPAPQEEEQSWFGWLFN